MRPYSEILQNLKIADLKCQDPASIVENLPTDRNILPIQPHIHRQRVFRIAVLAALVNLFIPAPYAQNEGIVVRAASGEREQQDSGE